MTLVRWLGEVVAGMTSRLRRPSGRARDHERSQLPPTTRFPRWGDVYEPRHEVEVTYLTRWRAPYTGGGTTRLRPGDQVVVSDVPMEEQPLAVYVDAADYAQLEARVVPESDRQAPGYEGFYLHLRTADLAGNWRLLRERPQRSGEAPNGHGERSVT